MTQPSPEVDAYIKSLLLTIFEPTDVSYEQFRNRRKMGIATQVTLITDVFSMVLTICRICGIEGYDDSVDQSGMTYTFNKNSRVLHLINETFEPLVEVSKYQFKCRFRMNNADIEHYIEVTNRKRKLGLLLDEA